MENSPDVFTEELNKVDLTSVMQCDDVEMAWDRFKFNLAPYKELRIGLSLS